MKLTRISARNFKGRTFEYPLAPVTVVTGDNFAGKSAILDAIRVGLMGYLPRLGKQPGATWKLAGDGPEMEVQLATDQTVLSHVWRPSKTGASYEGSIPWQTPPVLLDAREYFQQTAAQRVDTVFRLSDPARLGYTDAKLLERIDGIEVLPMKVARPIIERVVEELGQSVAARKNANVQEWLGRHIERVKAQQKEAMAQAKLFSGQMLGTKPKARVGGPPKDLQMELDEAAIRVALAQADKVGARRLLVESELGKLPSDLSGIDALEAELAALADTGAIEVSKDRIKIARQKLEWARAQLESERATLTKIQNPAELECCPMCRSSAPGWRQRLEIDYERTTADVRQRVAAAEASVKLWSDELQTARAEFDKASRQDDARQIRRTNLNESLQILRTQQRNREKLESELSGMTVLEPVDLAELPKLELALKDADVRVEDLQAKQAEFKLWKADRARREEIEESTVAKFTQVEVLKAAVQQLIAAQVELVDVAFNELLATSARFTDGILRSPLVYAEGELGRFEESTFISWETFSGTEEAIAFAGLSVALAVQAPCKVVLLDELGRLTAPNKAKLLTRMVDLVKAGVIDCFVGADVARMPITGVDFIEL